ncbi:hypothetical protein F4776DRAFT_661293 [Hypoxylon sp. NC0597]|nr:hypothetical protein F4776DRAFT_661293 [Hypoxylon sp. NC0597]
MRFQKPAPAKETQQTQSQSDTVAGSEAAATGRDWRGPFAEAKDGMETTEPVVVIERSTAGWVRVQGVKVLKDGDDLARRPDDLEVYQKQARRMYYLHVSKGDIASK